MLNKNLGLYFSSYISDRKSFFKSVLREKALCYTYICNVSNRSCHENGSVVFDVDLDHAAWLVYVDAIFHEAFFVCGNGCCAASCSGSFGVTGAALPDFDVQVALIDLAADL